MIERFHIGANSQVVELASNDGYLLQYFVEKGVPVLGVEPAANVAAVAQQKGIQTLVKFFGVNTAREMVADGKRADLLLGNNVLAHVPGLNDFVAGMKILLKPTGLITMEFPHVKRLMEDNQFDTIYHEHFSYFSFTTVEQIFAAHDLVLFDVEQLPTHGGSLRIYARHKEDNAKPVTARVEDLKHIEVESGLTRMEPYRLFGAQVKETKRKLLDCLIGIRRTGKSVVGYGAPGKGNTLLNYCGIRTDFLDYTVDRNPYKQGKYTPGTHIPIYPPERIYETKPDYLFILPWNLKDEIMEQMAGIREWGGRFIVPIPQVTVYD
jgi:SAM-dependent methyltransferase